MADIKWSAFPSTTTTTAGDSVVGLHSGANERFLVSATPSASGLALWDANSNLSANNFLSGYATTATAAATTTLLVGSKYQQYFTGVTTQIVLMPVTSTLVLGQSFYIVNNSTGVVTVKSSGANVIQAMAAGSSILVTCILTSGTTAASWNIQYAVNADLSGAVLLAPLGIQTISTYGLVTTAITGGNLEMTGNTLSSINSNGNIDIIPNGSGSTLFDSSTLASGYSALPAGSSIVIQAAKNSANAAVTIGGYTNDTSAGDLVFFKSRSTTVGSHVTVASADKLGFMQWYGDDGTNLTLSAQISVAVNNTVSAGVVPSLMIIGTADAAGVVQNTMNINTTQTAFYSGIQANSGNITAALGNVQAGSNTNAGSLISYPVGGALGNLSVSAANSAGNFANVLTNLSTTGARTWSLPDATGTLALTSQLLTGAVLLAPSGTQTITTYGLVLPNLNTTGSVTAGLGAGGSPGSLISFPTTTGKGSLIVAASDNATGSFNTTITNALAYGQSQVITIPDSGASTAKFILSTGAGQTIGNGLTLTTPVIGAASATSIAFTSTSGIIGTTTNDSAAAGSVGEEIESVIALAGSVTLGSGVASDITSISLTAGDWDVWGNVFSNIGTSATQIVSAISMVTGTLPASEYWSFYEGSAITGYANPVPGFRIKIASPATIYLVTRVAFIGACTAFGGIYARRRR